MFRCLLLALICIAAVRSQVPPAVAPPKAGAAKLQPPMVPKPEELQQIEGKVNELEALLKSLTTKDAALVADVEVYAKAGRFLLEFPQTFFTQDGIDQSLTVLDQGLERARQLQQGQSPWAMGKDRNIHAYRSALDGSVQPYGVTIPASYDGTKPTRLYVWLHGRASTYGE